MKNDKLYPGVFQIHNNTVMCVRIFKPTNETLMNDIFGYELPLEYYDEDFYKRAARNVIDSMQGHHCDLLLQEIKSYCDELLINKQK